MSLAELYYVLVVRLAKIASTKRKESFKACALEAQRLIIYRLMELIMGERANS